MRKISLLLMMILVSSINYAQDCNCSSNLKWLIETFEKNDAGFQYVIDKKGKDTYIAHNTTFIEKASKIKNKTECLQLLNDWTEFFRKNHLNVQLLSKSENANEQTEPTDKEIIEKYSNSEKYEIKKKSLINTSINLKTTQVLKEFGYLNLIQSV